MSPYEIRLLTEGFRRMGLFAEIKPDHAPIVADLTKVPPPPSTRAAWQSRGLTHVALYAIETAAGSFLFAYAESADPDPVAAARVLEDDPWFKVLAEHLRPHPRVRSGSVWMPMETINIIGPTCPRPADPTAVRRLGVVSRLKPSAELTYRTLHQTNWPGVVDQMARSHRRCWVTFLIEQGADLWLFTYTEYVGTDQSADDAAMGKDPVTQRWWQHTQPCLHPLSDVPGGWTSMQSLLEG